MKDLNYSDQLHVSCIQREITAKEVDSEVRELLLQTEDKVNRCFFFGTVNVSEK